MFHKNVFISHSTKDFLFLSGLNNELKNYLDEKYIFLTSDPDTNHLKGGEDFITQLSNKIKRSTIVFAALSPNFNSSTICQIEMGMAKAYNKKIFPFLLGITPNFKRDLLGIFNQNTHSYHIYNRADLIKFFSCFTKSNNLNSSIDKIILSLPKEDIFESDYESNSFFKWYSRKIINDDIFPFLYYLVSNYRYEFRYNDIGNFFYEDFEAWCEKRKINKNLNFVDYFRFFDNLEIFIELLNIERSEQIGLKMRNDYIEQLNEFVGFNYEKIINYIRSFTMLKSNND